MGYHSYHIEASRSGFKELPDRILVREDGYLGAYKFDGEPIVDYWYVPEKRVDELRQENEQLRQEIAIREASEQEKVIEYLRQENVDWEDKYRALAKENAALRYVALDACQYLYGLIYKSYTFVPERVQGIADSLRRLGIEVPDA